ncbi:MAG: hypothetical protein LBB89_12800 [Treponema sp.]|jgi:hypothetical protein|nr:hypothetical protein [Treponema sp.]
MPRYGRIVKEKDGKYEASRHQNITIEGGCLCRQAKDTEGDLVTEGAEPVEAIEVTGERGEVRIKRTK